MLLRQHFITILCTLLRLPFAFFDGLRRPFVRRAWHNPHSIVLIKPCCIGDLLMTTPLLEVIQQNFPEAHITYVAGNWSKVIAEHHPAVHEVLDCGTVGIPGKYSLSDYMKLARLLRQRHFDLAFVLDRSPMLTLLPWLANIPRRVGPDSLGRGFSLTDRVPVSTSRTQLQHQADIYLDLARALHLPIDHPHMRFVPTQAERAGVQSLADSVKTPHLARVAVFPGGGSNPGMQLTAKRWSLDGYREIVRRLVEDLHMQVLLIGGKEDLELNESLLAPLNVPSGSVLNLAGQTQFGQTAAYLESCALFIGNDSSPMHLAAAVGTPVIAIFGPTSPQEYGPYPPSAPDTEPLDTSGAVPLELSSSKGVGHGIQSSSFSRSVGGYCNKHVTIWRHPTGQPCFFLGKMQACEHCTCMSSVTVDDVWHAIQRLIPHNEHSEAKP